MSDFSDKKPSLWRESYTPALYPELAEELAVDVAIVGGGITGLTAAYLLKKSGFNIAVVEKDTVGGGTTGRTTGKVTSQHNLIYADFTKRLGAETARLYGAANEAAVAKVAEIVAVEKIQCDWARDDHYTFTTDPNQVQKFKEEVQAAKKAGLPATFETTTPLPFEVAAAVKFTDQGKINAQKYVLGLAKAIHGGGSYVFEHSNVISIRAGTPGRIQTNRGKIVALNIIVATNVPTLPLVARGGYCILEYPTESYIVAGKLPQKLEGMYISPDSDNYSLLPVTVDGENYLLVGGEGHLSGMRGSTSKRYQKLANYADEHFGVSHADYHWSDRDYLSYDGPPLAGLLYPWSKNIYVASAFRKWGLSNGTASAMIIHDLITGIPNPWADIYTPQRFRPIKYIPRTALKLLLGK